MWNMSTNVDAKWARKHYVNNDATDGNDWKDTRRYAEKKDVLHN